MGTIKTIKRDDMVEVISGNEKGKRGKVLRVLKDRDRVVVEKVNLARRHKRGDQASKGGIIDLEAPLHVSNLAPVCEKCDRPVRVGFKFLQDEKKVRACKRCGEVFDQ
jgi:large subunit ribosomal protein L24